MIVQVSDAAVEDLLELVEHLSEFSAPAAMRLIDSFERVLEQLREFPESGQRTRDAGFRVLRSGTHLFIYEMLPDRILLSKIVDGRTLADRP